MKEDLLEILCCPLCKGDLKLDATRKVQAEIVEGTLTCRECGATYPIEDSIPNMLPPEERNPTPAKSSR